MSLNTVNVPGGPAYVFGKKNIAYQGKSASSNYGNIPSESSSMAYNDGPAYGGGLNSTDAYEILSDALGTEDDDMYIWKLRGEHFDYGDKTISTSYGEFSLHDYVEDPYGGTEDSVIVKLTDLNDNEKLYRFTGDEYSGVIETDNMTEVRELDREPIFQEEDNEWDYSDNSQESVLGLRDTLTNMGITGKGEPPRTTFKKLQDRGPFINPESGKKFEAVHYVDADPDNEEYFDKMIFMSENNHGEEEFYAVDATPYSDYRSNYGMSDDPHAEKVVIAGWGKTEYEVIGD